LGEKLMHNESHRLLAIVPAAIVFAFISVSVLAQEEVPGRATEPTVTIAGDEFSLSFLPEDVQPETKAVIADDLQLILGRLDEATFEAFGDEDRSLYEKRFQTTVTHRLKLGEQKRWLPKVLRTRFGVAVKMADTYHLLVDKAVVDAYQDALKQKQKRPGIFTQFDEFLAKLQVPEKRREIARDPEKAREMFYFHKMEPWERDEYYRRNLLPGPSATIRRPSLLDFTTLGTILNETIEPDIPAVLTVIQTREGGKEYVAKWPPIVYVDGHWRILVCPLP
jgi:hypothetical protein